MITVFRSRVAGPSSLRLTHLDSDWYGTAVQGVPQVVGVGTLYPASNFPVLIPRPQAFVPGSLRAPQVIAQAPVAI